MIRLTLLLAALTASSAAEAGWRDDVDAAVQACDTDPTPCETVASLNIRETRAGWLRVIDERITDPGVLPVLLNTLVHEDDGELAVAWSEALGRLVPAADARWAPAWAELVTSHPDTTVRQNLLQGLRRAPLEVAAPALRAALGHADPQTRADAARVMGGHEGRASFLGELRGTLDDPAAEVRVQGVRALGWTGDRASFDRVATLLGDGDAQVRAHALQALTKLDAQAVKPLAAGMVDDPEPTVRRLADRLAR